MASLTMDLHDAELTAATFDRSAKVTTLTFGLADGVKATLWFEAVIEQRVSDIRTQNVVSRAFVTPDDRLDTAAVRRIVDWIFSLPDGVDEVPAKFASARAEDVVSGRSRLFYVESSWGAEIAILCGAVSRADGPRP